MRASIRRLLSRRRAGQHRSRAEDGALLPVPSTLTAGEVEAAIGRHEDWFYEFRFANGAATSVAEEIVREIHQTRAKLVFPKLDQTFGNRWSKVECLDMACHQGWFALQCALRGARSVRGIDIRPEHVERARLVGELAGANNLAFEQLNLYDLDPARDGPYDLTLFLGILYHLENPVGALKVARSMTRELCVIETQVARPAPDLTYAWGSDPNLRSGHAMAVGRVDEHHVAEGEAVVLLPTLPALYDILRAAGFSSVDLAEPPPGVNEQFAERDRVVIFAGV